VSPLSESSIVLLRGVFSRENGDTRVYIIIFRYGRVEDEPVLGGDATTTMLRERGKLNGRVNDCARTSSSYVLLSCREGQRVPAGILLLLLPREHNTTENRVITCPACVKTFSSLFPPDYSSRFGRPVHPPPNEGQKKKPNRSCTVAVAEP